MIIGLTGKNAAGKGEVAQYLKEKKFHYLSLSDVLRQEATRQGLDHSRDTLVNLGNRLRTEFGPEYLAKEIMKIIEAQLQEDPDSNFIVDSIRSPFEAKELMQHAAFVLVGVDAPSDVRFERMQKRGRIGDANSFREFQEQEKRENQNSKASQQLNATFELAETVLVNDSALEALHKKTDALLEKIQNR